MISPLVVGAQLRSHPSPQAMDCVLCCTMIHGTWHVLVQDQHGQDCGSPSLVASTGRTGEDQDDCGDYYQRPAAHQHFSNIRDTAAVSELKPLWLRCSPTSLYEYALPARPLLILMNPRMWVVPLTRTSKVRSPMLLTETQDRARPFFTSFAGLVDFARLLCTRLV